MKKVITLFSIFLLTVLSVQAQIKKPVIKLPNNNNLEGLSSNLDMNQIKNHINTSTFCYKVNLTSTAIIPPNTSSSGQILTAIDTYYTHTGYLKTEKNYLRVNGLLLRSDKGFSRHSGNSYEVLLYPDSSDSKKIDKNMVKITWRTPEKGLKTFHLKHVDVQYKSYGILIIGNYEIDSIVFGVSLSLIPTTCLL